jgi:hypothetical protein
MTKITFSLVTAIIGVGNLGMMSPLGHLYWSDIAWRNAVSPRPVFWSGMKRSLISSPKYDDY